MTEWAEAMALAAAAAQTAGEALQAQRLSWEAVDLSAGKDIKLAADREAERVILDQLSGSPYSVLSEEAGGTVPGDDAPYWVVDPLDGSFNYLRGMTSYGVSIGLCRGREALLGVFYSIPEAALYRGGTDEAASRAGVSMAVSTVDQVGEAVLATGFPAARSYETGSLMQFVQGVQAFKKVRMIGSAATSLAWVACGRVDAYWEEDIFWWDVAAGIALVQAAGGRVRLRPGSSVHQVDLLATNAALEGEALSGLLDEAADSG